MPKLEAYSIYDRAVSAYMRPFYTVSKGEALRLFMDACKDQKSAFFAHPEDYTLYLVGYFEDSVGIFTATVKGEPEKVLTALEVVNSAVDVGKVTQFDQERLRRDIATG